MFLLFELSTRCSESSSECYGLEFCAFVLRSCIRLERLIGWSLVVKLQVSRCGGVGFLGKRSVVCLDCCCEVSGFLRCGSLSHSDLICMYIGGISMWRLNEDLLMEYQASMNSRACFDVAWPSIFLCAKLNVCVCSSAWFEGSDSVSCLFIALLCSVKRVSSFLEVCPMYCAGQSLHEKV